MRASSTTTENAMPVTDTYPRNHSTLGDDERPDGPPLSIKTQIKVTVTGASDMTVTAERDSDQGPWTVRVESSDFAWVGDAMVFLRGDMLINLLNLRNLNLLGRALIAVSQHVVDKEHVRASRETEHADPVVARCRSCGHERELSDEEARDFFEEERRRDDLPF
jgi:hypothetical protein